MTTVGPTELVDASGHISRAGPCRDQGPRWPPRRSWRPRSGPRRDDPERGSATVYVLADLVLLALAATSVLGVTGVAIARHRAETAADLGSLAGADVLAEWLLTSPAPATLTMAQASSEACARASVVVLFNGAALTSCEVRGLTVQVVARRSLPWAAGRPLPMAEAVSAAEAQPDADTLPGS